MSIHGLTITLLLSVVSGMILGYRFPFASEVAVVSFGLAVIQAVLALYSRKSFSGFHIASYTTLVALAICIGVVRVQLTNDTPPLVCDTSCTVRGTVIASPEAREMHQRLTLSVDDEHAYVHAYVPLYPKYSVGDVLEVTGVIKEPEVLFPHDSRSHGFDYASYLSNRNIGSQMMFPKVRDTGEQVRTLGTILQQVENNLAEQTHEVLRSPASSFATGMLFGRDEMPNDITEMFRIAGVSHIVVLSGFNIAIIVSAMLLVFTFVPLMVRIGIALFAVLMFVAMVGGEASIIRAVLMASIALLAVALGRAYVAKQALLLSFIAIILYKPELLLTDVSLHLSFIATAGIVYLTPLIKDIINKVGIQGLFSDIVATTGAAYIATLPYQLYMFGTVSLYALFANILIVPLVPFAMLFSFVSVCVSYVGEMVVVPVAFVTSLFLEGMIGVIGFIATLPFALIDVSFSFGGMILAYVGIVTLLLFLTRAKYETELSSDVLTKDETIYTY